MKKNVLLAVLIIGLAFIAIQKPDLSTTTTNNTISNLNIASIQNITITSSDKDPIKFVKKNQTWHVIIDNIAIPADEKKTLPLFKLLNAESLDSFSISDDQLEEFHLLSPRLVVQFDNFVIAFGDSEPLKHRRYILSESNIHLIQNLYFHLLLQPAKSYAKIESK